MPTTEACGSLGKRCHNCGLPCTGMFCCDWCSSTYLARYDAHQAAHRPRARSRPVQIIVLGFMFFSACLTALGIIGLWLWLFGGSP